jgi:hypothetical protein
VRVRAVTDSPHCSPCPRCEKQIEAETARIIWAYTKEVMEFRMNFRVTSLEQFMELIRRKYDPVKLSTMLRAAGWKPREPECPKARQAWAGVEAKGIH